MGSPTGIPLEVVPSRATLIRSAGRGKLEDVN
jgi:hypothetical protein